jgi:hypothetical protein
MEGLIRVQSAVVYAIGGYQMDQLRPEISSQIRSRAQA